MFERDTGCPGPQSNGYPREPVKRDRLHPRVRPGPPVGQPSICPFALREVSVLTELALGHLRYHLTDVPPQPNSQPDSVFDTDRPANGALILENEP